MWSSRISIYFHIIHIILEMQVIQNKNIEAKCW
jgi:hypothetical protein